MFFLNLALKNTKKNKIFRKIHNTRDMLPILFVFVFNFDSPPTPHSPLSTPQLQPATATLPPLPEHPSAVALFGVWKLGSSRILYDMLRVLKFSDQTETILPVLWLFFSAFLLFFCYFCCLFSVSVWQFRYAAVLVAASCTFPLYPPEATSTSQRTHGVWVIFLFGANS